MLEKTGAKEREWRRIIVDFYRGISPEAYHMEDAAYILNLNGPEELNSYLKTVHALLAEGVLITKHGDYVQYNDRLHHLAHGEGSYPKGGNNRIEGVYKNYGKGFGFLICPEDEDIYISEVNRMGALHQDRVEVELLSPSATHRRREGKIVRVLERANRIIVGTFDRKKNFAFVTPDDERLGMDIYVPLTESLDAHSGAKVQVEVTKWPEGVGNPEGKVTRILGYEGDKDLDIDMILARHNLPFEFPKDVTAAANACSSKVEVTEGRMDLRSELMVTIDGADAKDLDDAVSLTKLTSGNYRLGVHIADVSHYVQSGGTIDKEAYARGTSVYVVDRVIPMLPEALSNGLCSLNAGEDRYAMSCIMDVSPQGEVLSSKIGPSVIHVERRCTYREVYQALKEDILPPDLEDFMPLLRDLEEFAHVMIAKRRRDGALDFDLPEYRILLSEDGRPIRIVKRDRTIAEQMIEQCMLLANETVAQYLYKRNPTAIYRIHEEPKREKVESLAMVMRYLGKDLLLPEEISPAYLQAFLDEVEGTDVQEVAQMMTLRAMQQAKYSAENKGHFGLGSKCYTHFTSPIRRYPDLMVHRLVKKHCGWGQDYQERDSKESYLVEAAQHSSEREQVAVAAEREVEDLKKTEYMLPFLGQAMSGKVTGITSFGMFVALDNGVEGLVSIDSMDDDYYFYEEEHFVLVGKYTNKRYHLGDAVVITVARVDLEKKQIDFVLGDGEDGILRMEALAQKRVRKEQREAENLLNRGKRDGKRRDKHRLTQREIQDALDQNKGKKEKKRAKKGKKGPSKRRKKM